MMLQRNGQIPNGTLLRQMVQSSSTNLRTRNSNKSRTISESSSSESECKIFSQLNSQILFTFSNTIELDYYRL